MSFHNKYLKYKNKYLKLKKQIGGNWKVGDKVIIRSGFDKSFFLKGIIEKITELSGSDAGCGSNITVRHENGRTTDINCFIELYLERDIEQPPQVSLLKDPEYSIIIKCESEEKQINTPYLDEDCLYYLNEVLTKLYLKNWTEIIPYLEKFKKENRVESENSEIILIINYYIKCKIYENDNFKLLKIINNLFPRYNYNLIWKIFGHYFEDPKYINFVKFLLDNNVDVNIKDKINIYSKDYGYISLLQWIKNNIKNSKKIYGDQTKEYQELIDLLVSHGAK
jgi:hypothetical protein